MHLPSYIWFAFFTAALTSNSQQVRTASQLIDLARSAIGGDSRLESVKTLTIVSSRKQFSYGQEGQNSAARVSTRLSKISQTFRLPGQYLITEEGLSSDTGAVRWILTAGLDGVTAWSDLKLPPDAPRETSIKAVGRADSPDRLKEFRFAMQRYLLALLLHTDASFPLQFTAPGEQTRRSGEPHTVVAQDPDGFSARLLIDDATGLLQRMQYDSIDWQLSDYKAVDGIRLPFRIAINSDGKLQYETVVTSVTLNAALPEDFFKQKK